MCCKGLNKPYAAQSPVLGNRKGAGNDFRDGGGGERGVSGSVELRGPFVRCGAHPAVPIPCDARFHFFPCVLSACPFVRCGRLSPPLLFCRSALLFALSLLLPFRMMLQSAVSRRIRAVAVRLRAPKAHCGRPRGNGRPYRGLRCALSFLSDAGDVSFLPAAVSFSHPSVLYAPSDRIAGCIRPAPGEVRLLRISA